jgi:hypothetical protein
MTNFTIRTATARATAFFFAFVASATVLGVTVAGMQPRMDSDTPVVAMDTVTVTANKVN